MNTLVLLLTTVAAASAALRGYNLPAPTGPSFVSGQGLGVATGGISIGGIPSSGLQTVGVSAPGVSTGGVIGGIAPTPPAPTRPACPKGELLHMGRCITPRVNRRVFLYEVPANVVFNEAPRNIPEPTIESNVILVNVPTDLIAPEPIVVAPPQQQHVVYVLNKQREHNQGVITVTAPPPSEPEIYFVNYADGENPILESAGVDLQTALEAAAPGNGQNIGATGGNGGITTGLDTSIGVVNGGGGGNIIGSVGPNGGLTGGLTGGVYQPPTSGFVSAPQYLYNAPN